MTGRDDTYRISGTLATGGTAVLYKAVQTSLERPVVIKRLHAHLVSDPTFMRRFELEAKSAASLDHENIVRIIDFGRDEDGYFIVMEYIDGPSLKDVLAERRTLDDETALLVAREICAGLSHAHERGIVHRDIKPANIMITRSGAVKITDFGLVKQSASALQQTVASTLIGTPLYMSPEQAIGETVDGRSDLFSLGTICYEALTGAQPFLGDTYAAVIRKITETALAPPSRRRSGVRPSTDAIVMRALARDPARRFRDAADMARAIESALGQEAVIGARRVLRRLACGPDVPSPPPPRRAVRRRRARGAKTAWAAGALAGSAALVLLALFGPLREGLSGGIGAIRRSDPVQADAAMIPTPPGGIFAEQPPRSTPDTLERGTAIPDSVPVGAGEATAPAPADSSSAPGTSGRPDSSLSVPTPIPPAEPPAASSAAAPLDLPSPRPVAKPDPEPTGYLDLLVEPAATVLVDGEPQTSSGRIAMLEIPTGPHRILCKKEGYRDYVETVVILKGEASRRRIVLREISGSLIVEGVSGARIYVDGTLRGSLSSEEPLELPPGPHTVEIRKPGFAVWRNVVHVPAEEPLRLSIRLVPASEAR